jgi:hypothetical protein
VIWVRYASVGDLAVLWGENILIIDLWLTLICDPKISRLIQGGVVKGKERCFEFRETFKRPLV